MRFNWVEQQNHSDFKIKTSTSPPLHSISVFMPTYLIVPGRGILLLLEDLRLEHSISISISHSRRCYHAGSHGTATPSGRHSYQGIPQALLKL